MSNYIYFFVVVVVSVIGAKVIHFVLKNYVKKLTEKTKSDIDDKILQIVTKPFYVLIILWGVYVGLKTLPELSGYMDLITNGFFVLTVGIVALVVSKIVSLLITNWLKVQERFQKTPQLLNKIISIVIYLIAILMIMGYFNIEITPIVAAMGLGGLAIGLALQQTLSDFFAGLHIISDKPINIGDFIELPDSNLSGYVEDIGWRSTKIRTLPNNIVVVPNSKLAESIIINDCMPVEESSVVVQCGVSYDSDLDKVEKVTIDVAKKIQQTVPGAVKDFEPFIRYHTFGDSNINFSIILRVEKPVDKYKVVHEFIKALKKRYDKEGIEISWPVRKIYQAK